MGIKSSRPKPDLVNFNKNGFSGINGKIKNSFITVIDGDTFDVVVKISTNQLKTPRQVIVNRRTVNRPIIEVINNKNVIFNISLRCRLNGIDTPEKNTIKGIETIDYVKKLLETFKKWSFSLEKNDKYGRTLINLFFKKNNNWINLTFHLIELGYGVSYNGGKKIL